MTRYFHDSKRGNGITVEITVEADDNDIRSAYARVSIEADDIVTRIEVRRYGRYGSKYADGKAEVNWPAIGSVEPDTADKFAELLREAISTARWINELNSTTFQWDAQEEF